MQVESLGGMTEAIIAGLPKQRIEQCAVRQQAHIDSCAQVRGQHARVEGGIVQEMSVLGS